MIKDCEIILNNDAVTVVDFDGIEVQLPPIKTTSTFLKVSLRNGKYEVITNEKKETRKLEKPNKVRKRKNESTNAKKL